MDDIKKQQAREQLTLLALELLTREIEAPALTKDEWAEIQQIRAKRRKESAAYAGLCDEES